MSHGVGPERRTGIPVGGVPAGVPLGSSLSARVFRPILAGATLRERLIGCLGALIGIALTGLVSGWIVGEGPHIPLIVAPMGATAVLLFAVPASPLAQPWPIIGGNTISALIGVTAAHFISNPVLAIGVGVSLAIAVMSFTRCLHPPGGAAALTALIGGPAIASSGFLFPFVPVCLNSLILVGLGIAFHRVSGRTYPHVAPATPVNPHGTADAPAPVRVGFNVRDVDAALLTLNETLDIDRTDLDRLLREVEAQALQRTHGTLTCGAVMSRDVITLGLHESPERARDLLLRHNIRTLPVVSESGQLVGTVGLRELSLRSEGRSGQNPVPELARVMSEARTAEPDAPVLSLVEVLTNGHSHAVVVTAPDDRILGIVTQTDLLAVLTRLVSAKAFEAPDVAPRGAALQPAS
ncbi:HPP family protein [Methylobacterium sp. 37f]|nr:HPP family protein [Methylobacterium sp. 37f]MCK2056552.1 HPP family protein [Methylobacterium sp. 37f]